MVIHKALQLKDDTDGLYVYRKKEEDDSLELKIMWTHQ